MLTTAAVVPDAPPERTAVLPRGGGQRGAGMQIAVGFVLVLLVYCTSQNLDTGDGFSTLPSAHSLLYDGDLDLGEFQGTQWYATHYGLVDLGDRRVTYFPWFGAVIAAPFVAAGDGLSTLGLVTNSAEAMQEGSVGWLHLLPASAVSAAAAVVLGLLTRRLFVLRSEGRHATTDPLGPWSLTAWIVLLGLATSLWSVASRSMGQHAPSVLLGGGAMLLLVHLLGRDAPVRPQRASALLGALLALSYWERPTNLVLTAVALGVLVLRRRHLVRPMLLGTATVHVLMLAANALLVGRAVPPYFTGGRVGWHDELPEAVAANLVSPARGLLLFSPFVLGALLLALPGRRASLSRDLGTYALIGGLGALAYLAVVSGFKESWWAGESYGPRFMTESLILLGPLALVGLFGPAPGARVPRAARLGAASLLFVWSFLVHGGGASVPAVDCWNTARAHAPAPGVWDWSRPQLLEGPRLIAERGWSGATRAGCDSILDDA